MLPVLLTVCQELVEPAAQSEQAATSAENALNALNEFCDAMQDYEIKDYLDQIL